MIDWDMHITFLELHYCSLIAHNPFSALLSVNQMEAHYTPGCGILFICVHISRSSHFIIVEYNTNDKGHHTSWNKLGFYFLHVWKKPFSLRYPNHFICWCGLAYFHGSTINNFSTKQLSNLFLNDGCKERVSYLVMRGKSMPKRVLKLCLLQTVLDAIILCVPINLPQALFISGFTVALDVASWYSVAVP